MLRAWLFAVSLSACELAPPFVCDRDAQCRLADENGVCEPGGHCSFGDSTCRSGRRFDELAGGDVAGTCVGDPAETGCLFDLEIGDASMCARRVDGTLACWGRNTDGQLSSALASPQLVPAVAGSLTSVADVRLGERHACVRVAGDRIRCLGKNNAGQLGDDTVASSGEPVEVVGLGSVRDLDVHGDHSCTVTSSDGGVWCWGRNVEGQLGDGTLEDRHAPVRVATDGGGALVDASAVTAGRRFTCALSRGGTVACWGENAQGQLGDGTIVGRALARDVGLAGIVEVVAGRDHVCARGAGGSVWCWGADGQGQIGDAMAGGTAPTPKPVTLPGPARALALGHNHTCALIDRDAWCWGKNSEGQIADPPSPAIATPVRVEGVPPAVTVAAGFNNTCVLADGGELRCRGSNTEGQLATGTTSADPVAAPVAIAVACP